MTSEMMGVFVWGVQGLGEMGCLGRNTFITTILVSDEWVKYLAQGIPRFAILFCSEVNTVKAPFRGHPRDKEKCPLNGGVPLLEVTSTKIIGTFYFFRDQSLCPLNGGVP